MRQLRSADKAGKLTKRSGLGLFLESNGIKCVNIEGDGNCLFRALVHQLASVSSAYQTIPADHKDLRAQICDYIEAHSDDFAPFIADSTVEEYLKSMRKVKVYGGNVEIVACSRMFEVDIIIYQDDFYIFRVCPDGSSAAASGRRALRLIYHGYEHYDSVEIVDSTKLEYETSVDGTSSRRKDVQEWQIRLLLESSPSSSEAECRLALEKAGTLDDAIEMLLSNQLESLETDILQPSSQEEVVEESKEEIVKEQSHPVISRPAKSKDKKRLKRQQKAAKKTQVPSTASVEADKPKDSISSGKILDI